MTTEVNGLTIHYTIDGSEPTIESPLYTGPFRLKNSTQLKAKTFKDSLSVGYLSEMSFPIHLAANQKLVTADGKSYPELTDLNYGKLHSSDKNWKRFKNGFLGTLQFDQPTSVKEVQLNALRFTILGIYPPKNVQVWGRQGDEEFVLLGEENQLEKSLIQGRNKINTTISFEPTTVSELKIKAESHRPLGAGHHRAGENSVIAVDEVVVY